MKQNYKISAVLAEGQGVRLEETCAHCDGDMSEGAIICPGCRLHLCAHVCIGQHLDQHPEHAR